MAEVKDVLSHEELASYFENMGMMVRAGIPLAEASAILRDETSESDGVLHTALSSMTGMLETGVSLADAMKDAGVFPDYAVDMTGTSEYAGRLEETLFHLSAYYTSEKKMLDSLRSAVRYPFVLLIMVAAVLAAMIWMVFPAFSGVYENLAGSLDASSYSYINISFALCRVMFVLILILLAGALFGVYSWKHGGSGRVRAFLSRFSAFRGLFESMDLYRFSSCFAMFLSAGENQDAALSGSIPVVMTETVRAALGRIADRMKDGISFSSAAYEEHLYDSASGRMLIPAEKSGMLDSAMQKITDSMKASAEKKAEAIADTAEPLLTGTLMIFVGVMLISIMLPLIGIMNSIG